MGKAWKNTKRFVGGLLIAYGFYVGIHTYKFAKSEEVQNCIKSGKQIVELTDYVLNGKDFEAFTRLKMIYDPKFKREVNELRETIQKIESTEDQLMRKIRKTYDPISYLRPNHKYTTNKELMQNFIK